MVRPRIKEYFSLRVRFGVGVEFPRVIVGGQKPSAITVSSSGSTMSYGYVEYAFLYDLASLILANDSCHAQ